MKKKDSTYHLSFLLICLFLSFLVTIHADNGKDVLEQSVRLEKNKNTIYHLLNDISEKTGLLFIYDSNIIDNEKVITLEKGIYTIRQAIYQITGNQKLELSVIGNHILIVPPAEVLVSALPAPQTEEKQKNKHFILEGILLDKDTHQPIEAGTVGVMNTSIGSVTNTNGEFRLILPDSLSNSEIVFSHLGHEQQTMPSEILAGNKSMIALEAKVFPIQEVVVRVVNPLRVLREMKESRKKNYATTPVYMTTFYREGIERKNKFISLTEAVFKLYKASYPSGASSDQVKLLKMRRISNRFEKDTVIAKMKSGINACLMLDIIRDMPDFLLPEENEKSYTYVPTDITIIDDRLTNVIYFEQKPGVNQPLYRGELYIDAENDALVRASFELHPEYIEKATDMLVEKKSKGLSITPQKVTYTISYKAYNGIYYIHHIRGDLHFRIKKRKLLSGSSPLHTWFEIVTCKIETHNVNRFTRNETLPARTIFAETNFIYDKNFWENFNVIPPEDKLNESIGKISSKIEETGY